MSGCCRVSVVLGVHILLATWCLYSCVLFLYDSMHICLRTLISAACEVWCFNSTRFYIESGGRWLHFISVLLCCSFGLRSFTCTVTCLNRNQGLKLRDLKHYTLSDVLVQTLSSSFSSCAVNWTLNQTPLTVCWVFFPLRSRHCCS